MKSRIWNFSQLDRMKARTKLLLSVGGVWFLVALVTLARPRSAHAQFGIDIAVIEAGLQSIQKALQSSVGAPLQDIQAAEKDWTKFEQTVVYSQQAIQQAKNFVTSLANPMQQMNQVFSMNYSSAQLPGPQQLEQQLLSRDPNQMANLGTTYHQVYGSLPATAHAPQNVQNSIDITDAEAQDGFKKAIQFDALAQREQEVAQQIQQQIQQAAPGSAPILEAEAAAWVVRANAYTQSAMAELMRLRSAGIANQSSSMKTATSGNANTNQNILQMLNSR
ncbi:MAG TPA: hypothetical protein VK608_13055 [Edaphobacter sp.]|nr:hypothetical protein [Edaphobacter sp.]